MSEGLADPMWTDATEDWPKQSWDFHADDGGPIETLGDLAAQLGYDVPSTVRLLLNEEFGKAAPTVLIEEARAYDAG